MAKKYFITGTDTDAGKTFVSCALLQKANQLGFSTLGLKPISAGCEVTEEGLRNSDALNLQTYSSVKVDYDEVNPIAYEPPIAPHIAAAQKGQVITASRLHGFINGTTMIRRADFTLVEGAGGWLVPLNDRETLADLAVELNYPVILVVGMKLGCINHSLLSVQAIQAKGLTLAGWVANRIDPDMAEYDANVATLKSMIGAPLLGEVPFIEKSEKQIETAASFLTLLD